MFPLDIIFGSPRGFDYVRWLSQYGFAKAGGVEEKFNKLSEIQALFIRNFVERITSYQVHFEDIRRGTSPDVICTVFETINTTGKKLTVFDLLVAKCYPGGIRLRDWLEKAVARETIHSFDQNGEELCVTALPRIIALRQPAGVCKRGDMLGLKPAQINEHWEAAVGAFDDALKVLVERYGCRGLRFVPLVDMIPPMALILSSPKFKASAKGLEKLDKWYWRCVFSQYLISSTETKMARSVKEWTSAGGWLDNDTNEPEAVRDFVYHSTILDGASRVDSAVYKGIMSLLLSRELKDFGKDSGKDFGKKGPARLDESPWHLIEDHHIYPKGFLGPYGIKGDKANNIANRTPLLEKTNIAISNIAPHVYLADENLVGPRPQIENVLRQHCIPPSLVQQAFTEAVFQEFIKERTALLLKVIADNVKVEPLTSEQ
jgi:hypothetical protein